MAPNKPLHEHQDDARDRLPSDGPEFIIQSGTFGGCYVPGKGAYQHEHGGSNYGCDS